MISKHVMAAGLVSAMVGCSGATESSPTEPSRAEPAPVVNTENTSDAPSEEVAAEQEEATEPDPSELVGAVTGGWAPGDAQSARVRDAAEFAVREHARVSGDTIVLVSIESVSQQVVAGMNYRLGLNITRNGNAEQATAVVFVQPWTNTTRLTSFSAGLPQ